jgi:hypothetical protein
MVLFVGGMAEAASKIITWDAQTDANGFQIYQSVDTGVTWTFVKTIADPTATSTTVTAPDSGLVLYRVSAYDSNAESIKYESGAWYNGDWLPLQAPTNIGIQ